MRHYFFWKSISSYYKEQYSYKTFCSSHIWLLQLFHIKTLCKLIHEFNSCFPLLFLCSCCLSHLVFQNIMEPNNFSFMNILIKIEIFNNFSRSMYTTKTFQLSSYHLINTFISQLFYLLGSLTTHLIYTHSQ